MTEMSNGELGRRINELSMQLAQGFAGVNVRLDRVNGRLDTQGNSIAAHAVRIAEHGVKLSNLNREVFQRDDREERDPETPSESTPITRRDLVVASLAIGSFLALVEWLPRLLSGGRITP